MSGTRAGGDLITIVAGTALGTGTDQVVPFPAVNFNATPDERAKPNGHAEEGLSDEALGRLGPDEFDKARRLEAARRGISVGALTALYKERRAAFRETQRRGPSDMERLAEVARLGELGFDEYRLARGDAAKRLGMPASQLDEVVRSHRRKRHGGPAADLKLVGFLLRVPSDAEYQARLQEDAWRVGLPPAALDELVRRARDSAARAAEADACDADPSAVRRPVIRIEAGILDLLATKAEEAIIASGVPVLQRGDKLVRPVRWQVPASQKRMTLAAGLRQVSTAALADVFSQVAEWQKFDARRKRWCPADPPDKVAAVMASRGGFWRVCTVAGVTTTPTLRPDGSILSEHGYDPATRLYHMLDEGLVMPPILAAPTRRDAEAALKLLLGLLSGFPFVGALDRAVALSGLITPVVRGALQTAPLHAFSAPAAGSGKSYIVDLSSVIATGRLCPVASAAADDDAETEKRLVGLLLAAFPVISLDNLSDALSGDLLCQAVERPMIRVRQLGGARFSKLKAARLSSQPEITWSSRAT